MSAFGAAFINEMDRRADASNAFIGTFAGASVAAGAVGAAALACVPSAGTGSSLISGATSVIGGRAFTALYENLSGYTTMSTVTGYSFTGANIPWLMRQAATRQSFLVGPGGEGTQLEQEFLRRMLLYEKIGDFLVPPVP